MLMHRFLAQASMSLSFQFGCILLSLKKVIELLVIYEQSWLTGLIIMSDCLMNKVDAETFSLRVYELKF